MLLLQLPLAAVDARHGIPLAAANLIKTGERYGYAHYLAHKVLMPKGLEQLHLDIQCKWSRWAKRLQEAVQVQVAHGGAAASAAAECILQSKQQFDGLRLVLSHAHGLLHGPWCQVRGGCNGSLRTRGALACHSLQQVV